MNTRKIVRFNLMNKISIAYTASKVSIKNKWNL